MHAEKRVVGSCEDELPSAGHSLPTAQATYGKAVSPKLQAESPRLQLQVLPVPLLLLYLTLDLCSKELYFKSRRQLGKGLASSRDF